MALFLSETTVPNFSVTPDIKEIYNGLLEASLDMHELTNDLLCKDFQLHENTNSEGISTFLLESTGNIQKFIIKVRDIVVAFFRKIAEVLMRNWKELNRKYPKEMEGKGVVKLVPGDYIEKIIKMNSIITNIEQSISNINRSYSEYSKDTSTLINKAKNELAIISNSLKKAKDANKPEKQIIDGKEVFVPKSGNGFIPIDSKVIDALKKTSSTMQALANKSHNDLTNNNAKVAQLEQKVINAPKLTSFANKAQNKKDMDELKILHEQAKSWMKLSGLTSKVHAIINIY